MTVVLEEWLSGRRKAFAQNPAYRPTPFFILFTNTEPSGSVQSLFVLHLGCFAPIERVNRQGKLMPSIWHGDGAVLHK